ncbi:MAG: hypothetical protein ACOYH4_05500, partial [Saccharofermentanales bacterium]
MKKDLISFPNYSRGKKSHVHPPGSKVRQTTWLRSFGADTYPASEWADKEEMYNYTFIESRENKARVRTARYIGMFSG